MAELKLTAVDVARKQTQNPVLGIKARFSHIKHWGVIIFRYDLVDKRNLTPQLIDAVEDGNDFVAQLSTWDGELKREWEATPGFKVEHFKLEEKEHTYSDEALRAYIKSFNDQKHKYNCILYNCHKFVLDLLCHLDLDDLARELIPMSTTPEMVQYTSKKISGSSITELKIDFPKHLGQVEGAEIEKLAKASWGSVIFTEDSDSAIKTKAERLFPVVASASVNLLKTDPKYFREATSPWQFIDVLAEVIVGQLMLRLYPEKKDLANEIASIIDDELVHSNGIGDIAMGLIGESISFLVRLMMLRLMSKDISRFAFQSIRDVFNNIIEPRRIKSFYNYAKLSILEGTMRHIVSVQNDEFKLSLDIEKELEDDTVALIKEPYSINKSYSSTYPPTRENSELQERSGDNHSEKQNSGSCEDNASCMSKNGQDILQSKQDSRKMKVPIFNYEQPSNIDEVARTLLERFNPALLQVVMPLETVGDGNCLFRAASIAEYGDERRHEDLRQRVFLEMKENPKWYNKDDPNFCSPFANNLEIMLENFSYYIENTPKSNSWCDINHILALSAVLNKPVESYYPRSIVHAFSRIITGRGVKESNDPDTKIKIMWTTTDLPQQDTEFTPNHFVPLIPLFVNNEEIDQDKPSTWSGVSPNLSNDTTISMASSIATNDSQKRDSSQSNLEPVPEEASNSSLVSKRVQMFSEMSIKKSSELSSSSSKDSSKRDSPERTIKPDSEETSNSHLVKRRVQEFSGRSNEQ